MDREQFDQYVEQYGARVSALAWSLCRSRADAEDLYQETWMKAMRHFDRYCPEKPFDKWIAAICVNTYKNTFRAFQRSRQMQFRSNEEKDYFLESLFEGREDRDTLIALRQAIEALAVKYQILIKLKYYLDYPDEDIPALVGVPVGTVKWRLHKAKELIARRMGDETEYGL